MLEQLTVATPGLSSDHVAMSKYFWLQEVDMILYDIKSAYKVEGPFCEIMATYCTCVDLPGGMISSDIFFFLLELISSFSHFDFLICSSAFIFT